MVKLLGTCALAFLLFSFTDAALGADDAKKGKGPFQDPEALFKKLDTNGDGKLSKDELKKLADHLPEKVKEKAGPLVEKLVGKGFEKLDSNGDGGLTLEEFKKLSELRGKNKK